MTGTGIHCHTPPPVQIGCICPRWNFFSICPLDTACLTHYFHPVCPYRNSWDWNLPPLSHFQHSGEKKSWLDYRNIEKNPKPNTRREPRGSLKKPTTVMVWRWEAEGMFQSAPALSLLMPSWTWPCGVHKALIFLLTVGDYSTGSWAEKMCSRRSPRHRERENKQRAPWCHFYSRFPDCSHVFIRGTQSKQFRAHVFLAVGRRCSFQIC